MTNRFELYADDIAGRKLDYAGAAEAAFNNGITAGAGVAGGKALAGVASVGATGGRLARTVGETMRGQVPASAIRETAREGLVDVSRNEVVQTGSAFIRNLPAVAMGATGTPSEVIADAVGGRDETTD